MSKAHEFTLDKARQTEVEAKGEEMKVIRIRSLNESKSQHSPQLVELVATSKMSIDYKLSEITRARHHHAQPHLIEDDALVAAQHLCGSVNDVLH